MVIATKNFGKRLLFAVIALSHHAGATNVGQIAGKYEYESYSFTLPNGEVRGFDSLGAKGANLEIRADKTILLTMHMIGGEAEVERAKIVKLQIVGNKGHWLAKWPEVPGLVRKDFTIDHGIISYEIIFTKENGPVLNGVRENGTLIKIAKP